MRNKDVGFFKIILTLACI